MDTGFLAYFKRLITQSWPQKLGAVGLAIVVWWLFAQSGPKFGFVVFPIQLIYSDIPRELTVVSELLNSVNVTLKIKRSDKNITKESFKLIIPMSNMVVGKNEYKILPDRIIGPTAEVINIEPSTIQIKLDYLMMKSVPINLKLAKKIPPDLTKKIKVLPKDIFISGPKQVISKLNNISTVPIEGDFFKKSSSIKVDLDLPRYTTIPEEKDVVIYLNE